MTHADYELLTTETIPHYIYSCPDLRHIFTKHEPLTITEVSHGNLNQVFDVRATSEPSRNVIVKQAPPYLNSIGASWQLNPARAYIETQALQLYEQIVPQYVPDVYVYDPQNYVIVMQNLDNYITWRQALIQGQMVHHVARDMGKFLARSIDHTANLMKNEKEKHRLLAKFDNLELCQMTYDYVFTFPFQRHDSNRYSPEINTQVIAIQQDRILKAKVYKMRELFVTQQQALIHGDLHTGSVMMSSSSTKVIDVEFACVGPISFDIGALFGNLWLSYASHEIRTPDPRDRDLFQHYIEWVIREIWQVFVAELEAIHNIHRLKLEGARQFDLFVQQLLQDVAGMAGCIVLRRVIGTSGVEDIRGIIHPQKRAIAATLALDIGRVLLLQRHEVKSIDQLIDITTAVKELRTQPIAT